MLIGFAVSALAVYFLLQQVKLEELGATLSHTAPLPIGSC